MQSCEESWCPIRVGALCDGRVGPSMLQCGGVYDPTPRLKCLICMQCMSNCMSYYEQQKSLQGLSFVFFERELSPFRFFFFSMNSTVPGGVISFTTLQCNGIPFPQPVFVFKNGFAWNHWERHLKKLIRTKKKDQLGPRKTIKLPSRELTYPFPRPFWVDIFPFP